MSRTRTEKAPRKAKGRAAPDALRSYEAPATPKAFKAPEPLKAKTATQARYLAALGTHQLVFGTGPAGGGKTYVAGAWAADKLRDKAVDKIILTRPAVEAGENLGFLPGELLEKYEPYLRPFRDVFEARLGRGFFEYALKAKQIEPLPLAFMRGMTFPERTIVLLDEAQNVTPVQMKMFLTRIGEGSTVVVTGDVTQKDIPGPSGLADALRRTQGLEGVASVKFTRADVVRSGLVQNILDRYATRRSPRALDLGDDEEAAQAA